MLPPFPIPIPAGLPSPLVLVLPPPVLTSTLLLVPPEPPEPGLVLSWESKFLWPILIATMRSTTIATTTTLPVT